MTKQVITHPAAIQRRGHLGRIANCGSPQPDRKRAPRTRNAAGLGRPPVPASDTTPPQSSVQAGHPLLLLREHRRQLLHDVDEMNLPRHDEKERLLAHRNPDILRQIMLGQIGANIHQNAAAIAQSRRFHKSRSVTSAFTNNPVVGRTLLREGMKRCRYPRPSTWDAELARPFSPEQRHGVLLSRPLI